MSTGEDPSAKLKEAMADVSKDMDTLAVGNDGPVADAMKKLGEEARTSAKAANPAADDDGAFEKAGVDVIAACKKAGVTINP